MLRWLIMMSMGKSTATKKGRESAQAIMENIMWPP